MPHLHEFDLPRKLLVTMFLLVLSCGFATAHLYLEYTMAQVSQEQGQRKFVPDSRDIVKYFHGSPGETRLKTMALGSMKRYFMDDSARQYVELTAAEQKLLDTVVAWCEQGAPESEYWNPQERKANVGQIHEILFNRGCFDCHARDAAGKGAQPDSPLDTYAAIARFTKPNLGMDTGRLLMLSHVHLLGMALMFLGATLPLVYARWPVGLRNAVIVGAFLSVLCDIGGWWATKWFGAPAAWMVLVGGLLMGVTFGLSVLLVLVDMWVVRSKTDPKT